MPSTAEVSIETLLNNLQNSSFTISSGSPLTKKAPQETKKETVRNLLDPISKVIGLKGYAKTKEDSIVGVEVENEFLQPQSWPSFDWWRVSSDTSLRYHGVEFVSAPFDYSERERVLRSLTDYLETKPAPTNSIRTSTHVHFDVTNYNFIDVVTFACVYWTLEGFLSGFAGEHRKGNLFCLRLQDAKATSQGITSLLRHYRINTSAILTNDFRYGSINFAALRKFGTLEFRLMRGTFEYSTLVIWLQALEAIRKFALKFKTPKEFREYFLDGTTARLLPVEVFGEDTAHYFTTFCKQPVETLIRESFDVADDIMAGNDFNYEDQLKALIEEERIAYEKYLQKLRNVYKWDSTLTPIDNGLEEQIQIVDAFSRSTMLATTTEVTEEV